MEIEERVKILEKEFNLPLNFYNSLLIEDDWSFVIKLSCLFERIFTFGLTVMLDTEKLSDEFSKLDQVIRVKWLKEMSVITTDQANFAIELLKLRNHLVHKVEQLNFSFSSHIESLDKNQIKKFIRIFGFNVKEHIEIKAKNIRMSKKEMLLSNPKTSIWIAASEVLACIHIERDFLEIRKQKIEIFKKFYELEKIKFAKD